MARIEGYGVKGTKSTRWRRTFKNADALLAWAEKNDAEVHGTRKVEEDLHEDYPGQFIEGPDEMPEAEVDDAELPQAARKMWN